MNKKPKIDPRERTTSEDLNMYSTQMQIMGLKKEIEVILKSNISEVTKKFELDQKETKDWVSQTFKEYLGDGTSSTKFVPTEILKTKANESDVLKMKRSISQINYQLEKGFEAIILSSRNEIKAAIMNSATQDDFSYLKQTTATKDDLAQLRQELIDRMQQMERRTQTDITFTEESQESEENIDDVLSINQRDELLDEENMAALDEEFKRGESWKTDAEQMKHFKPTPEMKQTIEDIPNKKEVIISKFEAQKEDIQSIPLKSNLSNKEPVTGSQFNSGESFDSHGGYIRGIQENRYVDPHGQKTPTEYSFGSSFYQKYQNRLKGNKRSTKATLRYLQVQINEMSAKLVENINSTELMRDRVFNVAKLEEDCELISSSFNELRSRCSDIDEDYKHIVEYYEFSKKQHEDILKFLHKTEKSLKENDGKMAQIFQVEQKEKQGKLQAIVSANTDKIQQLVDKDTSIFQPMSEKVKALTEGLLKAEEKIDDTIKEVINIDNKYLLKSEIYEEKLDEIQRPLQRQMITTFKQISTVFMAVFEHLKYLMFGQEGGRDKDYKKIIREFYEVMNEQQFIDSQLKTDLLSKTSQILLDFHDSCPKEREGLKQRFRPSTTDEKGSRKPKLSNSGPFSMKSSPNRINDELFSQPSGSPNIVDLKLTTDIKQDIHNKQRESQVRQEWNEGFSKGILPNKRRLNSKKMTNRPKTTHNHIRSYRNPRIGFQRINSTSNSKLKSQATTKSRTGPKSNQSNAKMPNSKYKINEVENKIRIDNFEKEDQSYGSNGLAQSELLIRSNVQYAEKPSSKKIILHRFKHLFKDGEELDTAVNVTSSNFEHSLINDHEKGRNRHKFRSSSTHGRITANRLSKP
ncbi:unnamed protein product [Moneuplotes crassus]|uniref:Uncharacterized protein n=1 Tax=Euplotes crassus TaxID=5936 RepID=A0AAD1XRH5_EUPCR|nr:unnamed protein product [Moneuplotes crassus]